MQRDASFPLFEPAERGRLVPLVLLGVIVLLVVATNLVGGPILSVALLVGTFGLVIITARPDYAIAILLGSFLVTYPKWMQGIGSLTLNNMLGLWLSVLLVYRLYEERDWSFLKSREILLLAAIGVVYFASRYIHQPDDLTLSLVGELPTRDQDPTRVFIGRFAFLLFMIYFVRKPRSARMLFVLAMVLFVMTGLAGVWTVLTGGGFGGYRAKSGLFIAAAGNPNRLALFSVLGIVAIWYLLQRGRGWLAWMVIGPLIPALVLAVFMTGSRSGVAGLLMAALMLFFEGGVSARKLVMGVLAGLVGALLVVRAAPERSLERIGNVPGTAAAEQDTLGRASLRGRSYVATLALDLAQENLLIGVGLGNWEVTRYLEDPARDTTPPHSAYLLALVEGGVITLGLYLLLIVRVAKSLYEVEWGLRSGIQLDIDIHWMVSSLRVGFIVFLAFSLVADLWLHVIFYLFVGLAVVLSKFMADAEAQLAEASA